MLVIFLRCASSAFHLASDVFRVLVLTVQCVKVYAIPIHCLYHTYTIVFSFPATRPSPYLAQAARPVGLVPAD